jgi:Subtilase family
MFFKTSSPWASRLLPLLCGVLIGTTAFAQAKTRIDKAADLPRFEYRVGGQLEDIVRQGERFAPLAAQVRRDIEQVLASYDIADKATQRDLLTQLALLDFLDGRYDSALSRAEQVKKLQDKPADQLMSGLRLRVMSQAAMMHPRDSDAYRKAVADGLARELSAMPFSLVSNDVRELKAGAELIGEALILGPVRDVMQPIADKSGVLSADLAQGIVRSRYSLVATLPLKQTFIDVFSAHLAANKVVKPDIWAARDVQLAVGEGRGPVKIAVWDSGVDTALFPQQLARDTQGRVPVVGFDKNARPSHTELMAIPPALQARLAQMASRTKGFSDLQSNIDSPEASEVKAFLSKLAPDQYTAAIEEISLAGIYEHGTHVAGIVLAGNPHARLVVARIEFQHTLKPDPCPSRELAEREAKAAHGTVAFLREQGVRVVNMSWGGDAAGIECALEQCGIGKTPQERKAMAREFFEMSRQALSEAFAGAPEILFITAAGNSNEDPTFVEAVPAAIVLPNLLTVGAVDRAGDEAGFTSYGPTVKVHANGYQVESFLPGGQRVALSGTSMAAPQVANLAAKMLAVNPALNPADLIRIIVDTGERSADGRRNLMHPGKALAAAKAKA